MQPRLECLSTGSAALDRILGGGLPARSVNVIAGEPGAGKTIFALQMLFHQARQGKKCLYLTTLSEPSLKLITYMQQFSFFDESLIAKNRVVVADLGSVVRRKGRGGDARRDHRPRRARGARGGGHRQLQGAPRSPRRRLGDADLRL